MSLGRERLKSLGIVPDSGYEVYLAKDIEKLFDESTEVWHSPASRPENEYWRNIKADTDTHTALIIGKRPIREETAEDLLREILDLMVGSIEKARNFLAKRGKG